MIPLQVDLHMITVYTITYNEEALIQFMIDHYRERFPNCRIVVYDNISTDDTVKIAKTNNCEVVPYYTHGQLQDNRFIKIKNHCWKDAKTDWVVVCDLDELLDINADELKKEEKSGATIIKSAGYHMITMEDKLDLAGIKYGQRDPAQDKSCLFNKKFVSEINYHIGCHACDPIGTIRYSETAYKLYNYCYINYETTVERYRVYRARISPKDIRRGCPYYSETPEELRVLYTEVRNQAIKVR